MIVMIFRPLTHCLMRLLDSIGGMTIAPLKTLQRTAPKRGFNDALVLLLLQEIAVQLPPLARAGWSLVDVGPLFGLLGLLQVLARNMITPLVAIAVGALLLRAVDRRGRFRPLDAAALCALPAISLQALFNLVGWIARLHGPTLWVLRVSVQGVQVAWFASLLLWAARWLRRDAKGAFRETGVQ